LSLQCVCVCVLSCAVYFCIYVRFNTATTITTVLMPPRPDKVSFPSKYLVSYRTYQLKDLLTYSSQMLKQCSAYNKRTVSAAGMVLKEILRASITGTSSRKSLNCEAQADCTADDCIDDECTVLDVELIASSSACCIVPSTDGKSLPSDDAFAAAKCVSSAVFVNSAFVVTIIGGPGERPGAGSLFMCPTTYAVADSPSCNDDDFCGCGNCSGSGSGDLHTVLWAVFKIEKVHTENPIYTYCGCETYEEVFLEN
uniref:Uncharacterized protein n=1 Tax=Glossina palpalis gambiensis TaxID=67801 RepID=A0A1B0BQR8_9MUSC